MEKNKKMPGKNVKKESMENIKESKFHDVLGGTKIYSPKETEEEWIDLMHIPKE